MAPRQEDRPILYEYFRDATNVLLSEYERSKGQNASANLGRNREFFCSEFLKKVLPPKLRVHSGEIWDSHNNRTGQQDVIILRDDAPTLHIGSDNIYLVEGVFAAIEVKSDLTRKKLKEAGDSLTKVKDLEINIGPSISSGPKMDRPLRIVFAYVGATWETLVDEIDKNGWGDLFDLICVLNKGVLIAKGRLLKWPNEDHFDVANGKAAALGIMHYYLISYSSAFVGRNLKIGPYYKPLNLWKDE